jgi:uncharacterized protein involved in cysteine biosynthesis
MMQLPLLALRLLFRRPQLFLLSLLPGALTLGCSFFLAKQVWKIGNTFAPLLAVAVFLISWLAIGNIALLPVEDFIIDHVQLALFARVKLKARHISVRRVFKETAYGFALAIIGVMIFLTDLLPGMAFLNFALTCLLLSYSFLSTLYSREHQSGLQRAKNFFKDAPANLILGAILSVLLFVPLLNVFLLGYAQILATLFYFRAEINRDRTLAADNQLGR